MPAMARLAPRVLLGLALASSAARPALAQELEPMTFEIARERSKRVKITLAALAGSALVVAGIGALFHLDSRDKSDEVSTSGPHTGRLYTAAVDDTRRAALRSRNLTRVSYGLAGGLLVSVLVVYIATDPGTETIVIDE